MAISPSGPAQTTVVEVDSVGIGLTSAHVLPSDLAASTTKGGADGANAIRTCGCSAPGGTERLKARHKIHGMQGNQDDSQGDQAATHLYPCLI